MERRTFLFILYSWVVWNKKEDSSFHTIVLLLFMSLTILLKDEEFGFSFSINVTIVIGGVFDHGVCTSVIYLTSLSFLSLFP